MAVLSPVAKQQFFDNDGNPAAGYLLYTYATGTSTPLATYSDEAGASPNANPIVLDSRGEATVHLTEGSTYDYVLKTAGGVTVWTRSRIVPPSSSTAFSQASVSGLSRSMLDKARDLVSLKDFGAIGDGDHHPLSESYASLGAAQAIYPDANALTNGIDSCALQLAIDYCIANGKDLWVPPGTYVLDSHNSTTGGFGVINLTFTASGQSLRVTGAGRNASIFKEMDGANETRGDFCRMFYMLLDQPGLTIREVTFADLEFDKNGSSNTPPADIWDWQQSHIFQCLSPVDALTSHVESFNFLRCGIRDKVAAGINLAMKGATVGRVMIDDLVEHDWSGSFGQRGALELTAWGDIYVNKADVLFSQTEPESGYEASADHPRNYFYSNCKIGTLQLQEPASASLYANVYVENCHIEDEFSTQGLMAHVSNSTVNLPREIYARRGKFVNTTILMDYDSGTNACDSVYIYNGNSNSDYRQEWLFDNCDFVLNTDDQDVLATGYQLQPSNGNKTDTRNMKIVRLNNCTFDPRVEKVCTVYEMGDWYFSNCKVRCWGSDAFNAGSTGTNPSFLSLSNNDYSELPSATNIVKINRNNELWVLEWKDRLSLTDYRMAVAGGGTFAGYTVRPVILSPGTNPNTTTKRFQVGDFVQNITPSSTAPAHGWRCTVAGSPGTWEAVGAYLYGSKTHDWADLATATEQSTTVTVTGAALGDKVIAVSMSVSLAGTSLRGYVSAADTVTVYHRNDTGANVNLGSGTLRVTVEKA